MTLRELRESIERKQARLAVVGLGYVGLPVACQFAQAGFNVLGVELRSDRVAQINAGRSPIEGDEPGLDELLKQVIASRKFQATIDYQELGDRDVILIDVETPVDEHNVPLYDALRAVLLDLGPEMKTGAMVIIESTIAPGTMNKFVQPLLSKSSGRAPNQGFYLGNCPERVMPGKLLANLRGINRVVGGMTPETAETMAALYRHVVHADLDPTDCITAELVKTTENAYRDVQIAFANEVALICEGVGGDVWKVRELVNKSPYRHMHLPGAGVGGHCIPKDPWLLAYSVKEKDVDIRLIPAARAVNDSMPLHIADLLRTGLAQVGCDLSESSILVMGFAYLANSDDARNSPSAILVDYLHQTGAKVVVHDPYITQYQGNLIRMAQDCDAVVVMVGHTIYGQTDLLALKAALKTPFMIDGRRVFKPAQLANAGYIYQIIGHG